MELPGAAIEAILARWPVADLATLRAGGRPHVVPVVFVHVDGALWSPVDGKPKSGRELARIRHVRRDPRVALLLHHYDTDWTRLWWLRVEGEAEVRAVADPEAGEAAAVLTALRAKYPEYARVPVLGPERVLLRIAIAATRSWCASQPALDLVPRG